MSPHNLQLQMQATAASVRAQGMVAQNHVRVSRGENIEYDYNDFDRIACEIEGIMQEVSHD